MAVVPLLPLPLPLHPRQVMVHNTDEYDAMVVAEEMEDNATHATDPDQKSSNSFIYTSHRYHDSLVYTIVSNLLSFFPIDSFHS